MNDTFRKEEYFALVKAVADFDQRLLTIKGWGVTLSLAALGLAFQHRAYGFFLVAAASSLAFWIIEHAAKRHQMRHYVRMREIEVAEYALAPDSDKRKYSSPRIDWSWHSARGTLSGDSISSGEVVVLRGKHRWYGFAGLLPHVAFPHVITFAVGLYYFREGILGKLVGFTLGASPLR